MPSETTDGLTYYAAPGRFTSLEGVDPASLPDDVAGLTKIVQGLLIHRAWAGAYQVRDLAAERLAEEGLHGAQAMATCIRRLYDRPLTVTRQPGQRMIGNCRHFATMLCALLRLKGVPARARCGFSGYFEAGKYVDHWVSEYWRADEGRWAIVDPQIDGLQCVVAKIEFDTLDMPPGHFFTAGQTWTRCREGRMDPMLCGIAEWWGMSVIGGNLMLDVASLNKVELLPWDIAQYGLPLLDETAEDQLVRLDRLAALTASGGADDIAELRATYAADASLRPPASLLEQIAEADRSGGGTGMNPLANA